MSEPTITTVHVPDFSAVTDEERGIGYSSRCQICGRRLCSGSEIIGSRCPGERQEDA